MSSGKGPPVPAAAAPAQEYVVRIPREQTKKHSILKFHHSLKIDLTKSGPMKMGRENNLREYRQAYDMDAAPKSGAGSEFGREQREEARRKKYGIYRKRYNPEDQPWHLSLGEAKELKKFKGVKEGTIADNVSYYVFTQCPDGAFEACPVDDWYNFTPQLKHRVLTAEEAEEEFNKRDHTLNYFSIMVRNKMKKDEPDEQEEEGEKKKGKKSKNKAGFLLTELDEWAVMSDGDVEENSDTEADKKKDKPKKKTKAKKKKSMKMNSDDEALEESDSFDEANEVDYMTDSDSDDEDMYKQKNREEDDKYKDKGVEDEEALKKLVQSEDEDEEEPNKEEEEENEEDSRDAKEKKEDDSDSVSSDSSGSDSDPEKEAGFSAIFIQKKKDDKKKASEAEARSRSATPTEDKGKKRKAETDSPAAKKVKVESLAHSASTPVLTQSSNTTLTHSSSSSSLATEGISEEAVRRYLLRKPMTTKDLVTKFKNTGLSKDQLVNTIAKILKRIDPEKTKVKDKLYLSIRKKE